MNSRAILVNLLVIIIILAGGGAAAYYYNQSANYIKTDNAQVSGQGVTVASPSAGKLTGWNAEVGKTYTAGSTLGNIEGGGSRITVTIPTDGTIVQQSAVNNSIVGAGTPLAKAFDLNNLWITANIDETAVQDLQVGQTVDVYIDAYPDTSLSGKLEKIIWRPHQLFHYCPLLTPLPTIPR